MGGTKMIRFAAINLNGISIAYVMGIVNAALALVVSFGVDLTAEQQGYLAAIVNGLLVLVVHVSHRVGEATASGASAAKSQSANEPMTVAAARRAVELHDSAQDAPAPAVATQED